MSDDKHQTGPSTPDLSRVELERRRVGRYRFYQAWAAHVQAGGDPSEAEWNAIAAECGIEPPARKAKGARDDDDAGTGLGGFLADKKRW